MGRTSGWGAAAVGGIASFAKSAGVLGGRPRQQQEAREQAGEFRTLMLSGRGRAEALVGRPAKDGDQGQAAGHGPESFDPVPLWRLGGDPGLDRLGHRFRSRRLEPVGARWRNRLAPPDQLIHPGLGFGGNMHLLPEQAEDLVHAGNFGQVDVGGQALLLVLGDRVGLQLVVHIAGDDIGVGGLRARVAGDGVPPLAAHAMDPLDQFPGIRRLPQPVCRSP